MDMSLGGLQELAVDREAWRAEQRVGHDWATELKRIVMATNTEIVAG